MSRIGIALLILAAASGLNSPGQAQQPTVRVPSNVERVTILTDGLANPASRSVLLVNELANHVGASGLRVLPIAGEGALANLRDLLSLKGVDLAILNSDILAYLDLTGEFPDARRRIRYVTHLQHKKIYVLARKGLTSLEALRGRKVAGTNAITARTLLATLKIDADLQSIKAEQLTTDAALRGIDGLVLSAGDIAEFGIDASSLSAFQIVSIAPTPALLKVYETRRISDTELPGVARSPGPVDGITVSTLLAVFDWKEKQSRYDNVSKFIKVMFQALPTLRDTPTAAIWRQIDVKASIPGWLRYPAAEPAKHLTPSQLAGLAAIDEPARPAPTIINAASRQPATETPLALHVVNRAPLADEREADGGLIPAIFKAGFAALPPGPTGGQKLAFTWVKSDVLPAEADVLLPWPMADCDRPNDLTQNLAVLCDRAMFSDPILQVVIGLFSIAGGDVKFTTDTDIHGRRICLPLDRDTADLTKPGRNWIAEKRIVLMRQPTLIDCISSVQRGDADAFITADIEGRHLLKQLGIDQAFAMAERPIGLRTIHAAVWKSNPRAGEIIDKLNTVMRDVKETGVHAKLIRQHLMAIWDPRLSVR